MSISHTYSYYMRSKYTCSSSILVGVACNAMVTSDNWPVLILHTSLVFILILIFNLVHIHILLHLGLDLASITVHAHAKSYVHMHCSAQGMCSTSSSYLKTNTTTALMAHLKCNDVIRAWVSPVPQIKWSDCAHFTLGCSSDTLEVLGVVLTMTCKNTES